MHPSSSSEPLVARVNVALGVMLALTILGHIVVTYKNVYDPVPLPSSAQLPANPPTTTTTTTTTTVPAAVTRPHHRMPANSKNKSKKLLSVPAFHSYSQIGFHSVRYNMEVGFAVARALDRKLILPRYMHMMTCSSPDLCRKSPCESRREVHWCPIDLFWDHATLTAAGGTFDVDRPGLTKTMHRTAFDDIHDISNIWFDQYPKELTRQYTMVNHTYQPSSGPLMFTYYKYTVGCELSFINIGEKRWSSKQKIDASRHFYSLQEQYGADDAELLVLEGRSSYGSGMPIVWSSSSAQMQFHHVLQNSTMQYHPDIAAVGLAIASHLDKRAGSFVAVHLLEDVDKAGATHLTTAREYIGKHRQSTSEPFYLVTDIRSHEQLDHMRAMGAVLWADVVKTPAVVEALQQHPVVASMLGYDDYVGLIEQMVCAQARVFIGTQCSPYTGAILNLRLKLRGDDSFLSFHHNDEEKADELNKQQ
jgi:hypothetical protein